MARLRGTAKRDVFTGTSGNDTILGLGGNDILKGGAGVDTIDGGTGNDTVDGGSGNDIITDPSGTNKLFGGTGNDRITGGTGVDTIDGGANDDTLKGAGGNDVIKGGTGADSALYAGRLADYDFSFVSGATVLTHVRGTPRDGSDTVYSSVETLKFSDITVANTQAAIGAARNVAPTGLALIEATHATEGSTSVSLDLLGGVTDPDAGASLSVANLTPPTGFSFGQDGRTLSVDPSHAAFDDLNAGQVRTIDVSYRVNDQFGTGFDRVARFTVTGVNDAPVAVDVADETTQNSAKTIALAADDADAEDTPTTLTYELSAAPLGTSLSVEGANLTFDPGTAFALLNAGETTDVSITYSAIDAQDASSGAATLTFTITGMNDAPVVGTTPQIVIAASGETSASVTLSATDADTENADASSFVFHIAAAGHDFADDLEGAIELVGASTTLSFTGAYEALAGGQIGEQVFDFVAVDLRGAISNTGSVTLQVAGVNDAPEFANASDFDGLVDHAGGDTELAVTSDFGQVIGFDPDLGDVLRFRLGGTAESPLLSFAGDYGDLAIDAENGTWQYTLFTNPEFGGVQAGEVVFEEFDIAIYDSLGLSFTEALTISIIV